MLYGLKRGTEQTQLALAGDARGHDAARLRQHPARRAAALVDAAERAAGRRRRSARRTLLAAGADPELVIATLETMDGQTTEGTAWLTARAVATGRTPARWTTWRVWAADPDRRAATPGAGAARRGRRRVATRRPAVGGRGTLSALQAALGCAAGPAVGAADALGPVPSALRAAGVPAAPQPQGGTAVAGTGATPGGPTTTAVRRHRRRRYPGAGTDGGGADPPGAAAPAPAASRAAGRLPGSGRCPSSPRPCRSPLPPPAVPAPLPACPGCPRSAAGGRRSNVPATGLPRARSACPLVTVGSC